MSNELRLVLMGFTGTLMLALAMVATYWVCQGWKIEKPFPFALWIVPGQLASFAVIGVAIWWWQR